MVLVIALQLVILAALGYGAWWGRKKYYRLRGMWTNADRMMLDLSSVVYRDRADLRRWQQSLTDDILAPLEASLINRIEEKRSYIYDRIAACESDLLSIKGISHSLNERLIAVETEPKPMTEKKPEQDDAPRGWATIKARAEQGERSRGTAS
jgi:hypothetical protein